MDRILSTFPSPLPLVIPQAELAELLKLWQNRRRSSADVGKIASRYIEELNQRMAEMDAMRRALEHLIYCCDGDH
jgi:MerR family copper efflux transcriptional regulator